MKKLILLVLIFISAKAFAQFPVPSGISGFGSAQFFYKISGSDTTIYAKASNGYWFPVGRKNNLVAKATDFEGAGTTSDKFGIRDTMLKSNWIIKSTSTSLPGLTIDAENSDLTTPTIAVFKFNGNRVSAIGSAGGYFGRGVFANSGGDYASVFTDTTGTLISRKKADSNPVLRLINLSSGSTGDFLFAGDSTSTKFRITRQGGIIAPLLTDTTGLTKSIVWNPSTGKFYTQTGGGGGGSDSTIYKVDDSLRSDRVVTQNGHSLQFQSHDPVTNFYGTTLLRSDYQDMSVTDSIGGASQIGAQVYTKNQSQAFMGVNTSGGRDKVIIMDSNPDGTNPDVKGIYFRDAIDSIGAMYYDTSSFKYGKRYNTWIPNWGSVKSRIDSAITAHGGSGITALTGDVTASGTGSVVATLATVNSNVGSFGDATHVGAFTVNGKGLITAASSTAITFPVTASNSVAFTNKTGNISQWTNDSGYITSASVPVAANPTASVGGSPVNGTATTFMRSDAAPKADTSVLQTVLNLFPKTDTRYKHDFTIAGHSIASNFNTTLATLSYGYGIALQSGTSTYDASGGSTFRVDTGATIQTVANFFPKGDTRYLKISSAPTGANPTATAGISAVNGSATTFMRSDAAPKVDSSVFRTVANSQTLAQTQTALNLKANLASPTFTGTVTIPNGGVFGTPTSINIANATGMTSGQVTTALGFTPIAPSDTTTAFANLVHINKAETILGPKTFNKSITESMAGITTSITTDGILVTNPTLATSSVTQQNPPVIRLTGHAWNATATAADNQGDYIMGVNMDRSNPSFPDPQWFLSARLSAAGSGAYTRFLTYDFYNGLTVTQALSVTGGVSTGNGITNSSGTIRSANFSAASAGNTMFIGNGNNFSASGTGMDLGGSTITNSSGTYSSVIIHPTYNQTSTAAATDLTINRVQTAVGSGAQLFVDFQVGGSSKFKVDNTGQVTVQAPVILKGYTVSTLPTGVTGMTAYVTDALTPASLATVVGGGASVVPVFYNGTNWIVQ